MRAIISKKAAILREESWNFFPYCTTKLTIQSFQKFEVTVDTWHLAQLEEPNAHRLSSKLLKQRKVTSLDIAADALDEGSTCELGDGDPSRFKSRKTMRGPLKRGWQKTAKPMMCAYKLVTAKFDYFGLRSKVEEYCISYERNLFLSSHKQLFCWIDDWYGLSETQIRQIEDAEASATNAASKLRHSEDLSCDKAGSIPNSGKPGSDPVARRSRADTSSTPHGRVTLQQEEPVQGGWAEEELEDTDSEEEERRGAAYQQTRKAARPAQGRVHAASESPAARPRRAPPQIPAGAAVSSERGTAEEFVASRRFKGSKHGFVFKMGDAGLGYYRDRPLQLGGCGVGIAGLSSSPLHAGAHQPHMRAPAAREPGDSDRSRGMKKASEGGGRRVHGIGGKATDRQLATSDDGTASDSDESRDSNDGNEGKSGFTAPMPVPKKKGGLLDKMAGLAVSQLVCPSSYVSLVLIPCDFTLFKCVPLSSHWYVVD